MIRPIGFYSTMIPCFYDEIVLKICENDAFVTFANLYFRGIELKKQKKII